MMIPGGVRPRGGDPWGKFRLVVGARSSVGSFDPVPHHFKRRGLTLGEFENSPPSDPVSAGAQGNDLGRGENRLGSGRAGSRGAGLVAQYQLGFPGSMVDRAWNGGCSGVGRHSPRAGPGLARDTQEEKTAPFNGLILEGQRWFWCG